MRLLKPRWLTSLLRIAHKRTREDSAVDRCPVEIWTLIIEWAAYGPSLNTVHTEFLALQRCETPALRIPEREAYRLRRSRERLRALALVCRTWWAIIRPLLLERVELHCNTGVRTLSFLLDGSFRGELKTSRIKRLDVILKGHKLLDKDPVEDFCWLSTGARDLVKLLKLCTALEEFKWDAYSSMPSQVLPALAASCGGTLTSLTICAANAQRFSTVISFIQRCPRLQVFICKIRWRPEHHGVLQFPAVPSSRATFQIDTLSMFLDEWHCIPWAHFLLSHSFVTLRCLRVTLRPMVGTNESPPLPTPFRAFMDRCGQSLRQLNVCNWGHVSDHGRTFLLFNMCCNLEEFIFSLPEAVVDVELTPHHALRSVGFHCHAVVFYSARDEAMMPDYVRKMNVLFTALCSPDFPCLMNVRCMELAWFLTIEAWTRALGYRHCFRDLAGICELRAVRFEDLFGKLFYREFEKSLDHYERHEVPKEMRKSRRILSRLIRRF